jgi:hypothetical protein
MNELFDPPLHSEQAAENILFTRDEAVLDRLDRHFAKLVKNVHDAEPMGEIPL